MSATVQLKAEPREKVGKGAARAARRSGLVPAVIYGEKKDHSSISITIREVEKQIESGNFLNKI